MNNYQDYYNYTNDNYNLPSYNQKFMLDKIFDPYQAFIRGNLFQDLYNTYTKDEPYKIIPKNEQAELLTYIHALDFCAHDLSLYLDVNPNDVEAIEIYNQYLKQKSEYNKVYQEKYGLIEKEHMNLNKKWSWIDSPWPWEGDAF